MHLEGGGTDLTSSSVLLAWNLLELTDALMSHTKASEAKKTRATLHGEASLRRRNPNKGALLRKWNLLT